VSQRQPHEQIRRAFSELTRPPRPQLTERVRDSLWDRPAPDSAPSRRRPVAVVLAAVVVLALIAGAVLEGPALVRLGRGLGPRVSRALVPPATARRPTPRTSPSPTAPPSASPSAQPSAPPSESPAPTPAPTDAPAPAPSPPAFAAAPPATMPGFSCAAQSGGGGQSTMTTARVGAQSGYDRFVVQFSGPVPRFEVTPQDSASFAQSGGPVTLRGGAGVSVVLRGASGAGVYSGSADMRPSFAVIQEARLLSDSQGVVQWGIGIARPACFHAWTLGGPSRLVIDIADP
jgi:hypothetical protein